jgi:ubiquinone biosynthesis accessory factor UbiK
MGNEMLNTATLDELAKRIGEMIDSSPARDIEKNVKALLQSSLQRLDLVPREEFELQAQVLRRTREKLEALETRVAEMEKRFIRGKGPA